EATLSPELYYPGRILMAEHQVMSWLPKHHSHKRDLVSHPNARINRRAHSACMRDLLAARPVE
ncbi:MAG: hypothetical protein LC776_06020, partial [Acidobacteria bacterium]|nr:hypothetical protein [Acidobacteriota bacterium]